MKRILISVVCLLISLILLSCNVKEKNSLETKNRITITVIDDVKEADIWILPDTAANKKTSVWGKATASHVALGESRRVPLCEPGDDGKYILRMIDSDSFYYSANGIELQAGWTLRIKEKGSGAVAAEVSDENGLLKNTYDVFSARL
jgi:hypothetical protein